ncbi:carboxymuconolactone decarboxylase family protein [Streptomyces aculeolatus]|uniref:carboxymuconolactone decarboxylase family protein n=1 Tax=Streptomyces aculeolatus TaxID=270689 RepID=UPI000C237A4F|nr:carboxymuconolactone decarboxylase family protein [Streptomyces aculeolatus]
MRPFLDKVMPEAWQAARSYSAAIRDAALGRGLDPQEIELIKVRSSQLNGCSFCLDLHSREAREAGVAQQKLDLLPAWRDSGVYADRETAALAVAEAATVLPLGEDAQADLEAARDILGEEGFVAAEWVAVSINMFNRISILSRHPVRPRGLDGKVIR